MFPYWLLFGIFAAGALDYRRRLPTGDRHTPLLIVAGIFTTLMIGLRYRVGGDWGNYERIFEELRYSGLREALGAGDPGYNFLSWVALQLNVGIWFVNLICGVIFTWGLVRFARRQPNPWLAMLIAVPYLIIVVAMGYTRQAVAIGFILAGLANLSRTGLFRFSFYVFAAVLFHKSAVVILPIAALAATRNKIISLGLFVVLGVVLYYIFVSGAIDAMVYNYVDQQYQAQGAGIRAAMNVPPALLFLKYGKRLNLSESEYKLWRNVSLAALFTVAVLMVSSATAAVDRLALYLIPLQMFVLGRLPDLFSTRRGPNNQILVGLLIYSAAIQFVWLTFATNAYAWRPYRSYFTADQASDDYYH